MLLARCAHGSQRTAGDAWRRSGSARSPRAAASGCAEAAEAVNVRRRASRPGTEHRPGPRVTSARSRSPGSKTCFLPSERVPASGREQVGVRTTWSLASSVEGNQWICAAGFSWMTAVRRRPRWASRTGRVPAGLPGPGGNGVSGERACQGPREREGRNREPGKGRGRLVPGKDSGTGSGSGHSPAPSSAWPTSRPLQATPSRPPPHFWAAVGNAFPHVISIQTLKGGR